MSEIKEEIKSHIERLSDIVYTAKLSYEIWWILVGPDRPQYIDTLNRYLSFFRPTIDAHYHVIIISLFKLFDKGKRTMNIHRLIKLVKKDDIISNSDFSEIEEKYNRALVIWEKVKIIRHKYYAHQAFNVDIKEVYRRAKITPDEFKELIELTTNIMNTINSQYNRTQIAYNMLSAKEDTYHLLDELQGTRVIQR